MKIITNHSLQGFEIFLKQGDAALKSVHLLPRQSIVVPESAISEQILSMSKRKILKIKNA